MSTWLDACLALLIALGVGWAIPSAVVTMLLPSLTTSGRTVRNYRGIEVPAGLGVVWLVWGVCYLLAMVVVGGSGVAGPLVSALLAAPMPVLLALPVFAFGLVDDAYGTSDAKGFRGHLSALARGRLTTGGLKVLGIGFAALFAARPAMPEAAAAGDAGSFAGWVTAWLLGAAAIALCANLVNLTDLRPGRALKSYLALLLLAFGVAALRLTGSEWLPGGGQTPGLAVAMMAAWVLVLAGPALAAWGPDLREQGMLGDAGANAMGALAGYLLVKALPPAGIAVAAVALLALNVASERVSFSAVIERTPPLRWMDGLGRAPHHGGAADADAAEGNDDGTSPERAATPAAGFGDEADTGTGKDGAS